jgi:hypothetical protein
VLRALMVARIECAGLFPKASAFMVHNQALSLLPGNAHSVPFIELRQSLPSKVAAVSLFADQLMRFILKFRSRMEARSASRWLSVKPLRMP